MKVDKFIDVRPFEDTIYRKNLDTLMAGVPIDKMPGFLTAGFMFDAMRYASPEINILGDLMKLNEHDQRAVDIRLESVALIIVQRDCALIGRYIAFVDSENGAFGQNLYLQIYGHFSRMTVDSLWPDHMIQLREVTKTDSGAIVIGPALFSENKQEFFTYVLAPYGAQLRAHAKILSHIPS